MLAGTFSETRQLILTRFAATMTSSDNKKVIKTKKSLGELIA